MRLGDLDALEANIKLLAKHEDLWKQGVILGIASTVHNTKTIDAVPVVRCKDCIHFGGHGACHFHAADENGTPIFVREDDFCSYGKRRGDG